MTWMSKWPGGFPLYLEAADGAQVTDVDGHTYADFALQYGALLLIDETHTFSAGPAGMTGTEGLQPDILVIGKSIGGGIACGAYGISADVAAKVTELVRSGTADIDDVGGVGRSGRSDTR